MERLAILVLFTYIVTCLHYTTAEDTLLSEVLTPTLSEADKLKRLSRSFYDHRYGSPRPLYDRLDYSRQDYDRPRCGRCDDRRDDRDDDDYDRRDRYDDDRRHKPTYGNRYDKKNYDSDEDRYSDRKGGQKNGTEEENNSKDSYDDKDRPNSSRRGSDRDRDRDRDRGRDRDRDRDRRRGGDRYDDRDRYRPDYYDRFLRDPYRERDYYDDYRGRRPLYERYPSYDDGLSRYDGYAYMGVRRPAYEDRYDDGYGGYGPSVGRGPHDRPWDETYRGQAGWDAGGRGYYFASGRPDATSGWGRPEYSRPQDSGYQSVGYSGYGGSYRDPYAQTSGYGQGGGYGNGYSIGVAGYGQGSAGYSQAGYGQGAAAYGQSFAGNSGYGQGSGWHSVGERRPYRDESGVKKLDSRDDYKQDAKRNQISYDQSSRQPANYGQTANYGQSGYQQGYSQSSSTTPGTSYLFQREDEQVTVKPIETTKKPS